MHRSLPLGILTAAQIPPVRHACSINVGVLGGAENDALYLNAMSPNFIEGSDLAIMHVCQTTSLKQPSPHLFALANALLSQLFLHATPNEHLEPGLWSIWMAHGGHSFEIVWSPRSDDTFNQCPPQTGGCWSHDEDTRTLSQALGTAIKRGDWPRTAPGEQGGIRCGIAYRSHPLPLGPSRKVTSMVGRRERLSSPSRTVNMRVAGHGDDCMRRQGKGGGGGAD